VVRTGSNVAKNSRSEADRTVYDALLTSEVRDLAPGAEKTFAFDLYTGPKSKSALSEFSNKELDKNIDFGFFAVIAWPLYYFLSWCNSILGNWGLAIIALTVVLKIILYPLTEKAFVAGKKMQKIQPELNALKEKFKDDRQAQQREMMAIMSQKGVNPMSGCLPILPQLPIFFGLNAVLLHTFELRHAPFAGWLTDLTDKDPRYVTPIIMAGLMYVQQKLTPSPASMDPAQQKMMQWLPVIFAVFMLTYPSGLVLYIITNTVLSLIQQQWIMKKYKDA
jgi:YidC/Oxa1 family membrane protein insertase